MVPDETPGTVHVVLGCALPDGSVVPSLVTRDVEDGDNGDLTAQRLEAVAMGLLPGEEDAGYVPSAVDPIDLTVMSVRQEIVIDLAADTQDKVIAAPGTSLSFFLPLVGSAFLDPAVDSVAFTLDGDAEAAATWWQASDLSWDRAEWEALLA